MDYSDKERVTKGVYMCKVSSFFTFCFVFAFWTFMAVHHAHMKTPAEGRGIASYKIAPDKPMYDASWKL